MSASILVITHDGIGQAMIDTAGAMMGGKSAELSLLSIPANLKPENLGYYADQVRDSIARVNNDHGVLILTDIFGATPNNLARYFGEQDDIKVISGLNLPMLVRVLNYKQRPLADLVAIALEGGHKGIQQDS